MAVIFALLSAALAALSYVFQHKANREQSGDESEAKAVLRLLTNRVWLFGILLLFIGFICQAVALAVGNVVVVMPILVTTLIFVLPFSAWISHTRASARDWLGAILVAGGLIGFLLVSQPGKQSNEAAGIWWLVAFVVVFAINGVLLLVGQRSSPAVGAALIGTASGLCNGLVGPFMAAAEEAAGARGLVGMLSSGFFWGMCIAGLSALVFAQLAFRRGPITAAVPTITAAAPLLSVLLGIWLFGEKIHDTAVDLVLIVGFSIVMVVGIVLVAQSKAIAGEN